MFLFYFCSWGMWDLSSPTRDRTHTICTGRWSLNHWTTSEVSYQYRFWGCSFCRQTLMITWNQLYTSDKPIWNPSSYYFQSFTHHPRPLLSWVLHAVLWHRVSVGARATRLIHVVSSTKKGNAKECSNYCTIALISHTSKVMLKILQARLQQYVNRELPDVQAGFRKGRGTRDQIANIHWIMGKAREF